MMFFPLGRASSGSKYSAYFVVVSTRQGQIAEKKIWKMFVAFFLGGAHCLLTYIVGPLAQNTALQCTQHFHRLITT